MPDAGAGEITAIAAVVAAVAGTTTAVVNYEQGVDAANAAKALAGEQAARLKAQSDAAAQMAAAQAISGQTFAKDEDPTARAAATGLGFQPTGASGGARAALTGMN